MSKIAQEAVARYCARAFDLPVVIARMNASYGAERRSAHACTSTRSLAGNAITTRWDPCYVQPDPPGRHQRADRGAARRGERAGDDRELGRRRGRQRAGVGGLHRRAHRHRRRGERASRRRARCGGRSRATAKRAVVHRAVHGQLEGRHPPGLGGAPHGVVASSHDDGARHRRVVGHRRGHRARRSPGPARRSASAPAGKTASPTCWRRCREHAPDSRMWVTDLSDLDADRRARARARSTSSAASTCS